jgi:MoaA/NifB/PqqE/SkfB family radical SAM enzyme
VREGTQEWVVSEAQRRELAAAVKRLRAKFSALFISFPGDEEEYGGCLAAGRGFVHIGPDGSLEPCPFAPYSDANVAKLPLREALRSRFLAAVRERHEYLRETAGGCALWENRKEVERLLNESRETPS